MGAGGHKSIEFEHCCMAAGGHMAVNVLKLTALSVADRFFYYYNFHFLLQSATSKMYIFVYLNNLLYL